MSNFKDIENFIDLRRALPFLKGEGWRKFIRRKLEYVFGISGCRRIVVEAAQAKTPDVFGRFMQILNILIDAEGVKETISSIPKFSGAVVIANHPYGGADAMALGSLCMQLEPYNTKILANSMVHHAPKFIDCLMPLRILGEPNATRDNLKTLKAASQHVKNGGLLVVFPAGGVSHYQKDQKKITDVPWSEHIARIAIKANVPVVPVKFFGHNSLWYQIIGVIHPLLRAAFIPRALLMMENETIKCRAGSIIDPQTLASTDNPTAMLRDSVYSISDTSH